MRKDILFLISSVFTLFLIILVSSIAPTVNLISPNNTIVYTNTNNITLNCNATSDSDIRNITFYHDLTGSFLPNKTINLGELGPEPESVLLMHFNNDSSLGENNTFVYDSSGNGNNGVCSGGNCPTFTNSFGKYFGAFDFDGINDKFQIPDSNSLDLTTEGALEVWINLSSSATDWIPIFSKGDGLDAQDPYALWIDPSKRFALSIGDDFYYSVISVPTDEFHHILTQWNSSTVNLYFDGVLDKTTPLLSTPSINNRVLVIGINTVQNYKFTGTIDELAIYNRTLTLTEIQEHYNRTFSNFTNKNFTYTNVPDGLYKWNCLSYDYKNSSENQSEGSFASSNFTFHIDTSSPPRFNSISIIPNSTDDIDPGVTINVTANITDPSGTSKVILQYKQSGLSSWANTTMSNTSLEIFNASFTTTPAGTWDYRIWANDTNGYSNTSVTSNITAEYDYTWTINTQDFGSVSGLLTTNKSIGILIINNTGDFGLNFDLSSDWDNTFFNKSEPFDLSAKNITHINVTATFNDVEREDPVVITVDATSANANPSLRYINATMVSFAGGAYLSNTIITAPTQVNQSSSINLYGKVKNIGNETALNTNLGWIVPNSNWKNTTGNLTQVIGNLTASSTIYNNVTINISSSVSAGTHTLYLNSNCSNNVTGCSDSESFTITVSCSNTDSVCGLGCSTENDDDCVAEIITINTGGGGGGGGGGTATPTVIEFSKIIEIVRGEENNFNIEVRNKFSSNVSLKNLSLTLEGFPQQYIEISPEIIKEIKPKQSANFTVKITIPSYKGYEEFALKATIKGLIESETMTNVYIEKQNIKLIVQELSKEKSNLSIIEAENAINLMKEMGFNVNSLERLLKKAKEKLSEKRNKEAQDIANEIIKTKEKAFESYGLINLIKEVLKNPRKINILTGEVSKEFNNKEEISLKNSITGHAIFKSSSVEEILNLAIASFERGDYATSLERAKSAKTILILERKGNILLFLYLYWQFILFGGIMLSATGIISYRKYQKISISKNIINLGNEEENIQKLITQNQKDYFSGKISRSDYNKRNLQHKKRIGDLKKEKSKLRNIRIKLLTKPEIINGLENETSQIEDSMKNLQKRYYVSREIAKSEYEMEFKVLQERVAEVESEKITLEILKRNKEQKTGKVKEKNKIEEFESHDINEIMEKVKLKIKDLISKIYKKGKEGVMFIDHEFIENLKEAVKDKNLKGKWIKINHKKEVEK